MFRVWGVWWGVWSVGCRVLQGAVCQENRARTVLAILPKRASVWGLGLGSVVLCVGCGDGGLEVEVWDLGFRT